MFTTKFQLNKFKLKVRKTFKKIKEDITSFKDNVSEWIFLLDRNQRELQFRVNELEKKLEQLQNSYTILKQK